MTGWLTLAPTSRSTSGLRSHQTPGCFFRSKQYSCQTGRSVSSQVSQNEANYPVLYKAVHYTAGTLGVSPLRSCQLFRLFRVSSPRHTLLTHVHIAHTPHTTCSVRCLFALASRHRLSITHARTTHGHAWSAQEHTGVHHKEHTTPHACMTTCRNPCTHAHTHL